MSIYKNVCLCREICDGGNIAFRVTKCVDDAAELTFSHSVIASWTFYKKATGITFKYQPDSSSVCVKIKIGAEVIQPFTLPFMQKFTLPSC